MQQACRGGACLGAGGEGGLHGVGQEGRKAPAQLFCDAAQHAVRVLPQLAVLYLQPLRGPHDTPSARAALPKQSPQSSHPSCDTLHDKLRSYSCDSQEKCETDCTTMIADCCGVQAGRTAEGTPTCKAAATNSCRAPPRTSMPTAATMMPTASVARTRQRSMLGCTAMLSPVSGSSLVADHSRQLAL